MRQVIFIFLLLGARLLNAESATEATREFPIKFSEGLLWLEVKVPQSSKPLNFLVDCGASESVLNLSTARRLGLKLGGAVSVSGVGTTMKGYWPVRLSSAKANQIELPDEYLALDLSKLSGACSNAVDGLLGADFFRDRVVQIDYAAQKLRVLDSAPTSGSAISIPLEFRQCGLRVPVSINGHKQQWMRLDTGCATALQWVTTDVPAEKCSSKPAVGLATISIPQTVTDICIGNQLVENVPTGLHRSAIFSGESGLLGNGLLSRFGVITIDAKSGRVTFGDLPNR